MAKAQGPRLKAQRRTLNAQRRTRKAQTQVRERQKLENILILRKSSKFWTKVKIYSMEVWKYGRMEVLSTTAINFQDFMI